MPSLKPYSAAALASGGGILASLGLYFAFVRPPLLPEDLRVIGASLAQIETTTPGLLVWLQQVFRVLGGYMFAAGILTFHVARAGFFDRSRMAFMTVAVAGLSSIGLMVVVNFLIDSDFKWLLLSLTLPWFLALTLYGFEKGHAGRPSTAVAPSESSS